MNTREFSDKFDVLLNSYSDITEFGEPASQRTIVLDEYEKSVFLTQAQREIRDELYDGKNIFQESFENTEELRRFLSELIDTKELSSITDSSVLLTDNSKVFRLPENLDYITYEAIVLGHFNECFAGNTIKVIPVTQDELANVLENPFRGPSKRRALRLDLSDNKVEIISKYPIEKYIIRYVAKLSPIVLEDLPDGLSIDGCSVKTECKLNPVLHEIILKRALKLALISKSTVINTGNK